MHQTIHVHVMRCNSMNGGVAQVHDVWSGGHGTLGIAVIPINTQEQQKLPFLEIIVLVVNMLELVE